MSVFFRWGVFGIIAVAALLYVYNASKHLSARHESLTETAAAPAPEDDEGDEVADAGDEGRDSDDLASAEESREMPAACVEEQHVAERALKMRRDGDPLDRLLRVDLIVLQADAQRGERLRAVATRWFEREGRDPDAAGLRAEVLRECRKALAAGPARTDPALSSQAP